MEISLPFLFWGNSCTSPLPDLPCTCALIRLVRRWKAAASLLSCVGRRMIRSTAPPRALQGAFVVHIFLASYDNCRFASVRNCFPLLFYRISLFFLFPQPNNGLYYWETIKLAVERKKKEEGAPQREPGQKEKKSSVVLELNHLRA